MMIERNFKEGCIILPDLAGPAAHECVAAALLAAFGGYTRTSGLGAWRDSHGADHIETVKVFTVSVEATAASEQELIRIARNAARIGQQVCVYVRLPDGSVAFVSEGDMQ